MTTYTKARQAIIALGLTCRRDAEGEIRVAFPDNESAAYYTDCPDDALATAEHMAATAAAHGAPRPDIEGLAVKAGLHEPGPYMSDSTLAAACAMFAPNKRAARAMAAEYRRFRYGAGA